MVDSTKIAEPNPARDAGWFVDTPWCGLDMAVFAPTKEDALRQAYDLRRIRIRLLEDQIASLRKLKLEARYEEAVTDGE